MSRKNSRNRLKAVTTNSPKRPLAVAGGRFVAYSSAMEPARRVRSGTWLVAGMVAFGLFYLIRGLRADAPAD